VIDFISRIKFPERKLLLLLLLIGCSMLAFVLIADEATESGSHHFDRWLLLAFRRPADLSLTIGPLWTLSVARDISALGGTTVITLVTFLTLGFLKLQRKPHMMALVFVSVIGGTVLSSVLKLAFARERPSVVPHLAHVTSLSFPSGHSMLSAVTYITLGVLLGQVTAHRPTKIYCVSVAVFLSFLIGLSRVFLGVHFPTDVLAGWCAGVAWATLCVTAARWLRDRGAIEPPVSPGDAER
jgi:undecaprenyl-diphosphatase